MNAAVGQAMRAIRHEAGLNQTQLAGLCKVGQETISAWERARSPIPLDQVGCVERACRVPAGALLRRAGLCGPNGKVTDVRAALEADADLDAATRAAILGAYDAARKAVAASRRRRS